MPIFTILLSSSRNFSLNAIGSLRGGCTTGGTVGSMVMWCTPGINQSINQSIKSFIKVSRIFSLQANWGHNGKVHKVKVQLELLKNLKNLLKKSLLKIYIKILCTLKLQSTVQKSYYVHSSNISFKMVHCWQLLQFFL